MTYLDYPILPLTGGIAYGTTTQVQTVQSANLLDISKCASGVTVNGPGSITFSQWAYLVLSNSWVIANLKPSTTYYIKCLITKIANPTYDTVYDLQKMLLLYSGVSGYSNIPMFATKSALDVGNSIQVTASFTTPSTLYDSAAKYRVLCYSERYLLNGDAVLGTVRFENLIISQTDASYTPFVPNSPSPDCPSNLVDTITAGAYRYARDGGNYQVTLPTMRNVGDVRDTWDAETGTFTQRVVAKVFDGSEDIWHYTAGNTSTFTTCQFKFSSSQLGYHTSLCNSFENVSGGWDDPKKEHYSDHTTIQHKYFSILNTTIGVVGTDDNATRVTKFKLWLAAQYAAGTPVIVYYQLATPVVSTITPELMYTDPVYDRTQADVDRARALAAKVGSKTATAAELAEWGTDLRGAVNASDLNRIETATAFLRDVLEGYGYSITLVTKTDWQVTDRPTVAQLARIRNNINALQAGFYTLPDWREIARRYLPSGEEATDYDILNAEEWDLHALGVWAERMVAHLDWLRSGEIYAGEGAFYEE